MASRHAAYGEDGRSRGFGHVQFDSVEGAAAALKLHGSTLEGREIFIDTAKERTPGTGDRAPRPGGELCCDAQQDLCVPLLCVRMV
jgi:hypothetical protein